MTWLRDSFVSQGTSTQASDLIFSSWRSKPTAVTTRHLQNRLVHFQPLHPSNQVIPIKKFFFPYYTPDESLCSPRALQVFEEKQPYLVLETLKFTLFLSWIGRHEPASSSIIARWLWKCLQDAGTDTDTFKTHLVRGAACSAAACSGVTVADSFNVAADWLIDSTFYVFTIGKYRIDQLLEQLSCHLLILILACWYENRAFWMWMA